MSLPEASFCPIPEAEKIIHMQPSLAGYWRQANCQHAVQACRKSGGLPLRLARPHTQLSIGLKHLSQETKYINQAHTRCDIDRKQQRRTKARTGWRRRRALNFSVLSTISRGRCSCTACTACHRHITNAVALYIPENYFNHCMHSMCNYRVKQQACEEHDLQRCLCTTPVRNNIRKALAQCKPVR